MAKGKNVLTTGDVAKICNVAPRTVSKWFDSGQLKGYRIPGSKDRRIPVSELIRFMKENDMPAPTIPIGKIRILIADSNSETAGRLADSLKNTADYEVQTARNTFESGLAVEKFEPQILLINLLAKDISTTDICKALRSNEQLNAIKVIAIANQLSESEASALQRKGFDDYVSDAGNIPEIIEKIEHLTTIVN